MEYPEEIVAYVGHALSLLPVVSVTFAQYLVATGQLPAGLSLDPSTGLISGTPESTDDAELVVSGVSRGGYSDDLWKLVHTDKTTGLGKTQYLKHYGIFTLTTAQSLPGRPTAITIAGNTWNIILPWSAFQVGDCWSAEGWIRATTTNTGTWDTLEVVGKSDAPAKSFIQLAPRRVGMNFIDDFVQAGWTGNLFKRLYAEDPNDDPNCFGFNTTGNNLFYDYLNNGYNELNVWYHKAIQLKRADATHWELRAYVNGQVVAYCKMTTISSLNDSYFLVDDNRRMPANGYNWDHFAVHFPRDVSNEWLPNGRATHITESVAGTAESSMSIDVRPQPVILVPPTLVLFVGQHTTVTPALNYDASTAADLFSAVDPPVGLLVDPDSGVVEGLPTTAGSHSMQIRMSPGLPGMSVQVQSGTCEMEVRPAPGATYVLPFRSDPSDVLDQLPDVPTSMSGATWSAQGNVPAWLTVDPSTGRVYGTVPSDAPQQTVGFTVRAAAIPDWTGPDVVRAVSFHVAPEAALAYDAVILTPQDSERSFVLQPQTPLDTLDEAVWFSVEPPFPPGLSLDPDTGAITVQLGGDDLMFEDVNGEFDIIMHSPYHEEDDPLLRTALYVSVQAVEEVCSRMTATYSVVEVPVGTQVQMVPDIVTSGPSNRAWQFLLESLGNTSVDPATGVIAGVFAEPTVPQRTMTVTASCGSSAVQYITVAYTVYERFEYRGGVRLGFEVTLSHDMGSEYTNFSLEPSLLPTGMYLNATNGVVYGTPKTWLGDGAELTYVVRCFHAENGTLAKGTLALRLEEQSDAKVDEDDDDDNTPTANTTTAENESSMGPLGYAGVAMVVIGVVALGVLFVQWRRHASVKQERRPNLEKVT